VAVGCGLGSTVGGTEVCGGGVEAQAPRMKMHMSTMTDRVKIGMFFMLPVPPLGQE